MRSKDTLYCLLNIGYLTRLAYSNIYLSIYLLPIRRESYIYSFCNANEFRLNIQ